MAWGLFAQQNTIKTAFRFSRINFYFVTAFYSLYDICMARQMIKTTILRYCMTVWAAPCPDGTRIYLKPTASSEGAPLWVRRSHTLLVPRSGTYVLSLISSWICQSRFAELFVEGGCRSYPQLRCFAACSGFLMVGPASRNHAASVRGRVLCTNKRLYVRLSRNGSRKT